MRVYVLAAILVLTGCSDEDFGNGDCTEEMVAMESNMEERPEEWNKYDSGGYHSWTAWYWSRGFSRTFTWGTNVYNCEVSDYTFSPI